MPNDDLQKNNPQPGRYYARRPSAIAPAYDESYWRSTIDPDGVCRDRTRERAQHLDDLIHELEFVNTLSPGRILDIGCGLGFFLSGVDDTWEKHGVEMSEFAVSLASQWGRIAMGPLEDVGYPSGAFDVVVIHHVIEHLEQPERTITEVRRVLAPGGRLVLGAPDFDSGCARRFGPRYRLLNDPTHISLFSDESMHRFLRAHGFLIEHVDYPYFDTRHFTEENLLRMLNTGDVSPPFYGNFMTFYCRKPVGGQLTAALQQVAGFAAHELPAADDWADIAVREVAQAAVGGGRLRLESGPRSSWLEELARNLWRQLEANHDNEAEDLPIVGAGHPAAPEDAVITFMQCDMAQSGGPPPFALEVRVSVGCGPSAEGRGDEGGVLRLPVLYGQTPAVVEALIVGGLLQELWSRQVGRDTP